MARAVDPHSFFGGNPAAFLNAFCVFSEVEKKTRKDCSKVKKNKKLVEIYYKKKYYHDTNFPCTFSVFIFQFFAPGSGSAY